MLAMQKTLSSDYWSTIKGKLRRQKIGVHLFYFLLRKYDEKTANFFLEEFSKLAVDLPLEIISKAMIFRYSNKKFDFSYIDCFGYMLAIENKRIFLTGDRAFKNLGDVELVR